MTIRAITGLLGVGIVLVAAVFYGFQALGHDSPQSMQVCLATSLATIAARFASSTLQAIFGGLALAMGLYMTLGKSTWRLGATVPQGLTRAILSPIVGCLSVPMGIGGGGFGVPPMTLFNLPIRRAVATAAGFGVLLAAPSVLGFLSVRIDPAGQPPWIFGAVNLPAFAPVVAMALLTTPIDVRLAHRLDPTPLERIFALFPIAVAPDMVRKALGW